MQRNWIELGVVAGFAVIAIVLADRLLQFVSLSRPMREVEHGVRDLRRSIPETLVIGSSHARTFHALGQELSLRTGRPDTLVAVPIENGKLFAYDILLRNHLLPIVDQRNSSATERRGGVRRFLLLTEWWDSCSHGNEKAYWNLPARAWEFDDFVDDLVRNGLNGYNRNYLQNRFRVLFRESALVRDRTQRLLLPSLVRLLRGKPIRLTPDEILKVTDLWQRTVEAGAECIGDPVQMESLRSVIQTARARNWETTVVLFPRKPATLTPKAKATTLATFAAQVRSIAVPLGAKVVDLTFRSPLEDSDFMEDFDHVSPEGNRKFADWALSHDLKFLLTPSTGAESGWVGR